MDSNTSDSNMSYPTSAPLSALACIPWIVLLVTESLLIVIVNLLTIIVFATQRQRHRRHAYLLIRNLAIADLLVGGISGPLRIEWNVGDSCDLWMYNRMIDSWFFVLKVSLLNLFYMVSISNITAIALERMHAIICPSRHLLMKKLVYKVIIAVIWLIAILRECAQIVFIKVTTPGRKTERLMNFTIYIPYYFISLLIICVSYTTIFMKIRYRSPPQPLRSSVIIKERQLTKTLFVVTVTSLLTLLPVIIFLGLETFTHDPVIDRSSSLYGHIKFVATVFILANSLANPIVYAMKMQQFRLGLKELFGRNSNYEVALPLHQK